MLIRLVGYLLMVICIYSGVYIQEAPAAVRPITGASLDATAMLGLAQRGNVNQPELLSSYAQFEQRFGDRSPIRHADGTQTINYLAYAAQGFFANGGKKLYVVRIAQASRSDYERALHSLDKTPDIGMLSLPGSSTLPANEYTGLTQLLVRYAETRHDRIILIDPPPASTPQQLLTLRKNLNSSFIAMYAPWLMLRERHSKRAFAVPPSGFVAGVVARVDAAQGIYKAPANEVIMGIAGVEQAMSESDMSMLNPQGVNVLRRLPDGSCRIWGARTTSTDPEWKYISVRRYAIYLEKSIEQGTAWAVFEPNTQTLWQTARSAVENFLLTEWRKGALQGNKATDAYFVRIDRSTMTQDDIDQGRLIMLIGVAVTRPTEFIILRISQHTKKAKKLHHP